MCVLKFANKEAFEKYLEHEEKMWHKAYPQFKSKVVCEKWCGKLALKMPHFSAVPMLQREKVLKLVEQTLREDFDAKNLVHDDVAWRNVGLYKNGSEVKAVVFDMTLVKERGESDDGWVDAAVEKLRRATRQDV